MTYNDIINRLSYIYDRQEARAIARRLLDETFGLSLTDIALGAAEQLSADDTALLKRMLGRLEDGEPLQYVTGKTTFCGLTFNVGEGVLIPRPETEQLVQLACDHARRTAHHTQRQPHILDIGTGSGCIAISIYRLLTDNGMTPHVTALDISDKALGIARLNAAALDTHIRLAKHDILNPADNASLPDRQYDIIVSNPPYICTKEAAEMHRNVLRHEPHTALFVPDDNPLLFYKAIAHTAMRTLKPQGIIMLETNRAYNGDTAQLLIQTGFNNVETKRDIYDNPRFVTARKNKS